MIADKTTLCLIMKILVTFAAIENRLKKALKIGFNYLYLFPGII